MRRILKIPPSPLAVKNWGHAGFIINSCKQLSDFAAKHESSMFPNMLGKTMAGMPDDRRLLCEKAMADVSHRLHHKGLIDSFTVMMTAAEISSHHPTTKCVEDTLMMIKFFYDYFVKNKSDDFIRAIFSVNKPADCLYPELIANVSVFRAWCENAEMYAREHPDIFFGVAENILSALGNAQYLVGDKDRCPFRNSKEAEREAFQDLKKAFSTPEVLVQSYQNAPGGSFVSARREVVNEQSSSGSAPDGKILRPRSANVSGVSKSSECRQGFFFGKDPMCTWVLGSQTSGIHSIFGPSGTTRASLASISMLMKAGGKDNFFLSNPLPAVMPIIIHNVLIPYLKASYHSPAEVMVAVHCFLDTAHDKPFHLSDNHPLFYMQETLKYQCAATSEEGRGAVEDLLNVVIELHQKCSTSYAEEKSAANTNESGGSTPTP